MKKTIGIIAEYNPLHNGHAYQIKYAKKTLNADYVLILMSGNFTQRGIPAIIDKYERAKLAIACGADLVAELPVCQATSSAEIFARSGISILNGLNIIDSVVFGAEDKKKDFFEKCADVLIDENKAFKNALSKHLKAGENYAKARACALCESTGDSSYSSFLSKPNNILGIEYVKALKYLNSKMDYLPIKRQSDFLSSTQIRNNLKNENTFDLPEVTEKKIKELISADSLLYLNDFSLPLACALINNNDFKKFLDSNENLSNRTERLKGDFIDFESFASDVLKTKNITHTHVTRFLTHILLNVTYSDFEIVKTFNYAPYTKILAVKKGCENLLSQITKNAKIPVFTGHKEALKILNEKEKILYEKDLYANDLYRIVLTEKSKRKIKNERSCGLLICP